MEFGHERRFSNELAGQRHMPCKVVGVPDESRVSLKEIHHSLLYYITNESTTGADASVEALKLYHMKLTSSLLALLAIVL